MGDGERSDLAWDAAAAAWRIGGAPAGPAGTSEFDLGGVSWRFDRIDPSTLVEAVVVPRGDTPDSPIAPEALDAVTLLCGEDVARGLRRAVERGDAATVQRATLAEATRPVRHLAGRRGLALEVVDPLPCPTWWTVEAAWTAARLGSADAHEHAHEAFDLLDAVPAELFAALADAGLEAPVRQVLLLVGLTDHDLPEPLRVERSEVDRRFRELVEAACPPPAASTPLLGVPTFRRSGLFVADAAHEHPVDWIGVPVDAVRRSVWTRGADGHVSVQVTAAGRMPGSVCVRLLDVGTRAPRVLAQRRLEPTGTRAGVTTLVATFRPPESVTELRVELVDVGDDAPMPRPFREVRHATNLARAAASLERSADAEVRLASDRAAGSARFAARAWTQAKLAWAAAGDDARAGECDAHATRLRSLLDPAADRARPEEASVAGWAEMATALTRGLLADLSAVGIAPEMSAAQSASLAGLAESVDDIELAARFRADQARSLRGSANRAIARLAARHFAALGVRPPVDLVVDGR